MEGDEYHTTLFTTRRVVRAESREIAERLSTFHFLGWGNNKSRVYNYNIV